jgi:hypothetical protein
VPPLSAELEPVAELDVVGLELVELEHAASITPTATRTARMGRRDDLIKFPLFIARRIGRFTSRRNRDQLKIILLLGFISA